MSLGGGGGGGRGPFEFDPDRLPQIPKINLPKLPAGGARIILIAVIGLILLWMSFYQIQPDEAGVVLRFGRYTDTTDPGPHLLIPLAERVIKVPLERQLKQEFGFRTAEASDTQGTCAMESAPTVRTAIALFL